MSVTLRGILVAIVTPFTEKLAVDEEGFAQHLASLASVPGMGGIVVNGHAGEGGTLTREEKKRCLRLAMEQARGRVPIVACIEALATQEAIALTRDAKECGAVAVMVCPPPIFAWNAATNPEFALEYHKAIAKAVDVPLVLFQYPPQSPYGYSSSGMLTMAREIKSVVAVKLALGGNLRRYEEDVRALKSLDRPVAALPSTAREFLQSFITGADGALTGFANIAPEECVAIFQAIQRGDLTQTREIHDRLYPATSAIYCEPYVNLHTRYKEATYTVGRIRRPEVRPPQLPLSEKERANLKQALQEAKLI